MCEKEIKRPNIPAIDELEAITRDIEAMKRAISGLEERLCKIPSKVASQLSSDSERLDAARYLYWCRPEVKVKPIADSLLKNQNWKNLPSTVGKASVKRQCRICQLSYEFVLTSRDHLKKIDLSNKDTCNDCNQRFAAVREAEINARIRTQAHRLYELRTMPYSDYLKTPEWKERRSHHLLSADYCCQVCSRSRNPENPLEVHHNTYERRGGECFSDLLVLCRECHSMYHEKGRFKR
jgi:hypothetical protein